MATPSRGVQSPPARERIKVGKHPAMTEAPRGQNPPIVVRLPRDEWEYVKKLGKRDNRSGAYYVQLALKELVRRHRTNPASVL